MDFFLLWVLCVVR